MDTELKAVINQQSEARKYGKRLLPYVFLNSKGDDRIKRFDKVWKRACEEAGIGHKIFHDLRITAVRNMVRSGIPEQVAMRISGHKSRCVFERYNIVNDADLIEASRKQEEYLNSVTGTNWGTVQHLKQKRG